MSCHNAMNILITNDDGIDADGLHVLAERLRQDHTVTVVAPAGPRSECSHQVQTREPIQVDALGDHRFAVHGSPVDCVRLGLRAIFGESGRHFDWVLSGINHGGNLGIDRYMSGTLAAAREAAILGVPSIAFSHYLRRGIPLDWDVAASRAHSVWTEIRNHPPSAGYFWNVNLPHLEAGAADPPVVDCIADSLPLNVQFESTGPSSFLYNGSYPDRPRTPFSDTDYCFRGHITRTLLTI